MEAARVPDQLFLNHSAVEDFRRARRQAAIERIIARFSGKSADLLSYDDVRRKLKIGSAIPRGLRDIPLDAIVGSVARYADFNRSFLPRNASDAERWVRVKAAMANDNGVPPIEVYQIGEVYFVLDGNHRVSVARQLGEKVIQAYVYEMPTKVTLSPGDQPDDLILKAEYAGFLEKTDLDRLRPEADLTVTVPGQYRVLEEHIDVHRYFMSVEQRRPIAYSEAVTHWYDTIYCPDVQIIRDQHLLNDFPGRTETDLYIWISRHRTDLEQQLGQEIRIGDAAADLASQHGSRLGRRIGRVSEKLLDTVTPAVLETGPAPGAWWQEAQAQHDERLFDDILVPVSGEALGWQALDQALVIARRENATLHGLHVIRPGTEPIPEAIEAARAEFSRRCQEAGIQGRLATQEGRVADTICERARWSEIVVVHIAHPPGPQPMARLKSGFRTLIQRCPRPVLCVPRVTPLNRALLAYDGSPKAEEGLFVATYLASRWKIPLVVVSVVENGPTTAETTSRARQYLEAHGVQATFVEERGAVAEAILKTAEAHGSELIIAGGYGSRPVLEVVLGSTVDELLRASRQPLLICR
jgi:nucleotide-binding universal stress UspA family protein